MYRLMVVDDEPVITNSLANMLESAMDEELDVYKAYSAFEALEYLERTSFDIMVLDIQMPGMSGIELLKRINSQWPSCRVVFLSGHDEFDYVYQAMQYHAVRYVLKNEGDEVLLEAIAQCIADIEQEALSDSLLKQADEKLSLCMPVLRRGFLQNLITKEMPEREERQRQLEKFGASLDGSQPVFLLAARRDDKRLDDLSTQIDVIVEAKLSHAVRSEICFADTSFMLWLIQPRDDVTQERAAVTVRGTAELIQRTCLQTLDVTISFVFDSHPCAWEELKEKSEMMRQAVEYLLEMNSSMAFVDVEYFQNNGLPEKKDRVDKPAFLDIKNKLDEINLMMSGGDIAEFEAAVQALVEELKPHVNSGDLYMLEILNQMDSLLLTFIIKHDLKEKIKEDPLFHALITGQSPAGNRYVTLERFSYLGRRVMELWVMEQKNRGDAFVHNLSGYINKHLGEDLSLVALSEKVYLNPSYLSRRYKELTGKNITDTITGARMERAAQLLKNDQYKIHRISEMVGYASAAHFSRVFKKNMNMTPQEYRERFR